MVFVLFYVDGFNFRISLERMNGYLNITFEPTSEAKKPKYEDS